MADIEKIVIIVQPTWLDNLIKKFNTKQQARFYIEYSGGSFQEYLDQHVTYYKALSRLKRQLPKSVRYQVVNRSFLPNFLFNEGDLVMVLGRDGLVINTAKYLSTQPVLGINPDPSRVDGLLLKFQVKEVGAYVQSILEGNSEIGYISVAQADMNNGQSLIGVNDIFVGHQTHQSARYQISYNGLEENQSSSGVIISTGIGSTGWMKSIIASSLSISKSLGFSNIDPNIPQNFDWDAQHLIFAVREAWKSNTTGNQITYGIITKSQPLIIESSMPEDGVIFSDGMEYDRLQFNSGREVTIFVSDKKITYYH